MSGDAMDTEQIRQQFPALERRVNGQAVAYFDGPGGTQVPRAVVDAIVNYLYGHNANAGWSYPSSQETAGLIDSARQAVACFLNADASEVVFGNNMTTLTFKLAQVLGPIYGPDAEIVVNELEHHANVGPWVELGRQTGAKIRVAKMDPTTGQIDWPDFESLCNRQTRLISIGAASNALGTINDVARAAELARSVGAQLFVDAVHFAAHELIDVQAMGCDFLACSAYKFYGPHVGILFVRNELLSSLEFPRLDRAPSSPPARAETGTRNHEGIAGVGATVDFLASLGGDGDRRQRLASCFGTLHASGSQLVKQLWDGLSAIEGVRVFGPPPEAPRTPTVSFSIDGTLAEAVSRQLAEEAIFVSHGDFLALTVVERLELAETGLVRAGCACYTTAEEVQRLLDAVGRIAHRGAARQVAVSPAP